MEQIENKEPNQQETLQIAFYGRYVNLFRKDGRESQYCRFDLATCRENKVMNAPVRFYLESKENQAKIHLFRELSAVEYRAICEAKTELHIANAQRQLDDVQSARAWMENAYGDACTRDMEESGLLEQIDTLEQNKASAADLAAEGAVACPRWFAVYSDGGQVMCIWGAKDKCLHSLFKVAVQVRRVFLTGKRFGMELYLCAANPYDLPVQSISLCVGDAEGKQYPPHLVKKLPLTKQQLCQRKYLSTFSLPLDTLVSSELEESGAVKNAGNLCSLRVVVDGVNVDYRLVKNVDTRKRPLHPRHSKRELWVPIDSRYYKGYSLQIRRGNTGRFVFYKRPMEEVEHGRWFQFMESKPVSAALFYLGRALNRLPFRKKTALFYEKYSEKAEEGTFELFQMCRDSKHTNSYFIIDEHAPDYARIAGEKHVVKKYSLRYYWLLYNVNYFISPEAPSHLSLMNAHNKYLRWTFIRHPFVFLQHGVTYLKRHGLRSTYVRDRAGAASYVVVNSEKERRIVSEMLDLSLDRIWNTGMMIFDRCAYKHITQASPDKVTVMLTWRQDEALLTDYEDSTYFQYNLDVYEMLLRYFNCSQINIVAHPRASEKLQSTSLRDRLWSAPISEALSSSKLLITDYSSVCWNSFYQGGGVVFFQPDLAKYEAFVGKLIPKPEEYVGRRVFDLEHLEREIAAGVKDGVIDLSHFRTEEDEAMYATINEHHDGQNTNRIYQRLKAEKIV